MINLINFFLETNEPLSPAASIASADIAAEFAALTAEEQEKQRSEWTQVGSFSNEFL